LYQKLSSGTEPERLVLESGNIQGTSSWSPDGAAIMYRQGNDLWMLGVSGQQKPARWTNTPFDEANGQFSPNGKWVAYTSNESGKYEMFVHAFQGSGKWTVASGGGVEPRWRADGKELFYLGPDTSLRAVPITASPDGRSLTVGTPAVLFRAAPFSGFTPNARIEYAVSADGERFLVNRATEGSTTTPITVVANWTAALSK
jgi:Tol biopolymer transport system component